MRKTSEIIGSPPKTRLGHAVGCEVKGCQSYADKTPAGYIYSRCVMHRVLNGERSSRLGSELCKSTRKNGGKCMGRIVAGTSFCASHHWESTGLKNTIYQQKLVGKSTVVEYPEDHHKAKNVSPKLEKVPNSLLVEDDIERLRSVCMVVFEHYNDEWDNIVRLAKKQEQNRKTLIKINKLELELQELKEKLV